MKDKQNRILDIVNDTLRDFNKNEQYLIINDLSERCICSKLAAYFERHFSVTEFSDYSIDVEYNRGNPNDARAIKSLNNKNIVVDIIIHKRGCDATLEDNNLVCMEMKKEYKYTDINNDIKRLKKLTNHRYGFNYAVGLMLLVRKNLKKQEIAIVIDSKYLFR